MNNYERIKNMSIEEMAEWLESKMSCSACDAKKECCYECNIILENWLQQEVSDEQK